MGIDYVEAYGYCSQFTLLFDTSPVVLKRLNEMLRVDPMVVRQVDIPFSVIFLNDMSF